MSKFVLAAALALGFVILFAGSNFVGRLEEPEGMAWFLVYLCLSSVLVASYGIVSGVAFIHRLLKRRR